MNDTRRPKAGDVVTGDAPLAFVSEADYHWLKYPISSFSNFATFGFSLTLGYGINILAIEIAAMQDTSPYPGIAKWKFIRSTGRPGDNSFLLIGLRTSKHIRRVLNRLAAVFEPRIQSNGAFNDVGLCHRGMSLFSIPTFAATYLKPSKSFSRLRIRTASRGRGEQFPKIWLTLPWPPRGVIQADQKRILAVDGQQMPERLIEPLRLPCGLRSALLRCQRSRFGSAKPPRREFDSRQTNWAHRLH